MKEKLSVIFSIDKSFIQHFSVTIVSLLENNKDIDFEVYVVHDIDKASLLNEVLKFIIEKYNIVIHQIKLDSSLFETFRVSLHYSKAVYFRLLFADLIPSDVDKALFLDSDAVITGSVMELAKFNFTKQSLLAVNDTEQEHHIERLNAMGFPVTRYFNAGILLINLKLWRENKVSEKLIELANKHMHKLAWWDQDILNMFFYDSWEYMDEKYNAIHLKDELPVMPIIVHYAGVFKPWLYAYEPPYKKLYWQYIKLTPFKDAKYPDYTIKQILRKNYYNLKKAYFPNFKLPMPVKRLLNSLKKDHVLT